MAKPIITTDTVGCREVVKNGKNGFLVPIKDSKLLANKIEILLKDSVGRKIMGENGRIMAIDEFDIQQVVKQYMKLYEDLGK
jgi:N,N'-diacetylbacillosaminyl-diphospho-undecaprenol alpha-1,3-N-acetylgalactosaminyltransferase